MANPASLHMNHRVDVEVNTRRSKSRGLADADWQPAAELPRHQDVPCLLALDPERREFRHGTIETIRSGRVFFDQDPGALGTYHRLVTRPAGGLSAGVVLTILAEATDDRGLGLLWKAPIEAIGPVRG